MLRRLNLTHASVRLTGQGGGPHDGHSDQLLGESVLHMEMVVTDPFLVLGKAMVYV